MRAAGPVGEHWVVLNAGGVPPYLNIGQSPYDFVYAHLDNREDMRMLFTVTGDVGVPVPGVRRETTLPCGPGWRTHACV